MNNTRRTALAGLLLLCFCPFTFAEVQDTVVVSEHTIENVEIRARRLSREVSSTVPAQSMSHETMRALAIQDVAGAVRHFAGTTVKDYGGIGGLKTVSVRGLGASHTAVSYDGVVIGNCQSGQIDLGRFSSGELGGISLHIGQDDDMNGTARSLASGSIVNMNSIQPRWTDKSYLLRAGYTRGSLGLHSASMAYSQKLGQQTWSNISAALSAAHGRYHYTIANGTQIITGQRNNTDVAQQTYEWSLHHEFADNSHIDTKVYHYHSERGLPGAVILYNNNSTERLADRNTFAQSQYTKQWGHQWKLRAIAKYTSGWNRYTETDVKYAGGKQVDENLQREYYGATTLLFQPTMAWSLSIAQDAIVNTLSSNLPSCPFPIRYTSLTALQAQYRNERIQVRGILLGAIVDEKTSPKAQPAMPSTTSPHIPEHKYPAMQELFPTLSTSIRIFEHNPMFVRMMYKKTHRMPTFNDLYYFRSGNKNLRPEYAHEYNVGITWQAPQAGCIEGVRLTADAYFNDVTDKIVAFPTTYVWKMANYGHVHITGLEASLSAQCRIASLTTLSMGASYTLQHALDVTDPEAQGYRVQLPYTPKQSGSCHLILATPWVNVGYSMIASDEHYSMSEHTARYRIAPYAEHTLTLSRNFMLQHTNLTVQCEAINFTNAQYEIIQYYPMPGRQVRLSLTANL